MIARVRELEAPLQAAWVLALGTVLSFLLSLDMMLDRLIQVAFVPMNDPWSPWLLRRPETLAALYVVPMALGVAAVVVANRSALRAWSVGSLVVGCALLVHQATFGWAVSVITFWLGLWALWLTWARVSFERGPRWCLLLIGGLFFYPAFGKITPGYLDGSMFWEFHWQHGRGIHGLLALWLDEPTHRSLARWFGPMAILVELAVAFAWLLPGRAGFYVVLLSAVGILANGGVQFRDAMIPVLALAASGYALSIAQAERGPPPPT